MNSAYPNQRTLHILEKAKKIDHSIAQNISHSFEIHTSSNNDITKESPDKFASSDFITLSTIREHNLIQMDDEMANTLLPTCDEYQCNSDGNMIRHIKQYTLQSSVQSVNEDTCIKDVDMLSVEVVNKTDGLESVNCSVIEQNEHEMLQGSEQMDEDYVADHGDTSNSDTHNNEIIENEDVEDISSSGNKSDGNNNSIVKKVKKATSAVKKERKERKNSGKEYSTYKNLKKRERCLRELKKCRNQCEKKINLEQRRILFHDYWAMKSHDRRVSFIANSIEKLPKKLERSKDLDKKLKDRQFTYKYTLQVDGSPQILCKACFLAILDETPKFIYCVLRNKNASISSITSADRRGKHVPIHAFNSELIDKIKNHIKSFPAYKSHYSRKHTDKLYLAADLNLSKMFKLYCQAMDATKEKPVSMSSYAKVFNELGLKFKKPKLDTCSTCDIFNMKLKVTEGEERAAYEKERNIHQEEADAAYASKSADKMKSKGNPAMLTFTFDLQQVLQTPHLTTGTIFYKRQLATYNLTIHNCVDGESKNYMWHECVAGRGANEIASCLYMHLMDIPPEIKHVVYYSDTCGGQNRNSHVTAMFTYALSQHPTLETIDHKFLVAGHTHMECDVDHSAIERQKKKCQFPIYHPRDWYQLVRSTGRRYSVEVVDQPSFLSFSNLLKGPLQIKKINSEGYKFIWRDVHWLRYSRDNFGVVQYKNTTNDESAFATIDFTRKGRSKSLKSYLKPCYDKPKCISVEKKKDLLSILNLIDKDVHQFYIDLPTNNKLEDTDADIDRYYSDADV